MSFNGRLKMSTILNDVKMTFKEPKNGFPKLWGAKVDQSAS